jgi:predicted 3-demethylubiquinone-9 3-methyltransferase (glyoxalase superfamily)
MAKQKLQKIVPFLWYATQAEEAAKFYATVFPDSRVDKVSALNAESPSGPAGAVKVVEFTLFGQQFRAMSAGPHDDFNDAISLMVECETQAELDRYWNAILEGGGKPTACGWINDRFGVRWQITPAVLNEWLADKDPVRSRRVAEEMMRQTKFDIAKLQAAYDGK